MELIYSMFVVFIVIVTLAVSFATAVIIVKRMLDKANFFK